MLYFGCWQPGGRADPCPKADSRPDNQGARAFIDRGKGLHAETALMTVSSDSHREIGHVVV